MKKKMARAAVAALSVLLCVCLTGCYRIRETITVGADGSVVVCLDEGVEKSTMDSLENLSNEIVAPSTGSSTSNTNKNANSANNANNANNANSASNTNKNTSTANTNTTNTTNTTESSDETASDYMEQSIQDYADKGWDVSKYDDGEYVGAKMYYNIDDIRKASTTTGTLDEWAGVSSEKTYSSTDDLSGYTPTNTKFFYHDTDADTYTFRMDVSSLNEQLSSTTSSESEATNTSASNTNSNTNSNSNTNTSANTSTNSNTNTNSNSNANTNSNAPATIPATSESVSALTNAIIDEFSVTLTLPQAPISSNATSVSDDGKTLTWAYDPEKGVITDSGVIECTFALPPSAAGWTPALIGGGVAALIVVIIVVVVALRARKRRNIRKQLMPEEWLRGEVEPAEVPDEPAEELLEEIAEIRPETMAMPAESTAESTAEADAEAQPAEADAPMEPTEMEAAQADSPEDTAPMKPVTD